MSSQEINNRKDVLLLLLYSPGKGDGPNEPIVGRTRLVKMLFLFKSEVLPHFMRGTEIDEKNFYQFFPWDFGPFSTQVYDDLTFFILSEFIESAPTDEESLPESAAEWEKWMAQSGVSQQLDEVNPYEEEEFKLTPKGAEFTKRLYDALSKSQQQLLKEFKARLSRAPLRAILKYVYTRYEEMTDRSKITGEILGHNS
jgi:hypothetical protein